MDLAWNNISKPAPSYGLCGQIYFPHFSHSALNEKQHKLA